MFFLGYNFLGADETTIPISPTIAQEETAVEVSGVMLDTLAITRDTTFEPSDEVSTTWNVDTILVADFNDDTLAGNVKWVLDTISHVAIKRRAVGEYKWVTIAVQAVDSIDDLNISGTDITAESLVYEYAIVPIMDGIEGDYAITKRPIDVHNSDLVLIDSTGVYHTPITDGFCDTTDVHPNSVLETLYNRYPTIVRNTMANYETVNVTGAFLPSDNDCNFNNALDDSPQADRLRVLYSRKVKEFLTNGRTKILKNVDGQAWLVYVTTPPTDAADGYYNIRKLTFGCTEIGSLKSEEDLYRAGLLDIPEEWWYELVSNE